MRRRLAKIKNINTNILDHTTTKIEVIGIVKESLEVKEFVFSEAEINKPTTFRITTFIYNKPFNIRHQIYLKKISVITVYFL